MTNPATIALFVFKRLRHTRQTVESLLKNEESSRSKLIVFCDGAKRKEDEHAVQEVRDYVRGIRGFAELRIIERTENYGLAKSIISGVTEILSQEEQVIVLEDDLSLSPHFLKYMNEGLELYAFNSNVASIHGYMYPVSTTLPETFFVRGADCWGWATWKRAWACFSPDGAALLAALKKQGLVKSFDYDGYAGNLKMLRKQIAGKNDSWAIRWHASAFLADMYTLYPGKSLVRNTGMDGQGTHGEATDAFDTQVAEKPIRIERIAVEQKPEILAAIKEFYKSSQPSLLQKIAAKFRR
jgi:hypothetical protein